ncbi:MAG: hypothetical protein KDK99_10695, partial [Verrucomicrobiales bacterium]|nr:hypothetical protein [Verrucomicrobiales bacterium]
LTDNDQDGLPWGIENALGTDTAAPTFPSPISPPTFVLTGTPLLTFPKNPAAIPGTVWILERSTDLQTFTEMWRYDGLTNTTGLSGTTFTITDPTNPRAPQTFYRFRATYQP